MGYFLTKAFSVSSIIIAMALFFCIPCSASDIAALEEDMAQNERLLDALSSEVDGFQSGTPALEDVKNAALKMQTILDRIASLRYRMNELIKKTESEKEVSPEEFSADDLSQALIDGDNDLIRRALQAGTDPDFVLSPAHGLTLLIGAALRERAEVVRMLLDAGADRSIKAENGMNALAVARSRQNQKIIDMLDDTTPTEKLLAAAKSGDTDALTRLLGEGVSPNVLDAKAFSPLVWAVHLKHYDAALILLQAGADPELVNSDRYTPLMILAGQGEGPTELDLARKLIDSGADVNAVSANGWTAMKRAEQAGYKAMIELLRQYGSANSLPDVKLSLFADAAATIPVSYRHERTKPLFLRIEILGGNIASDDEAELFFTVVRDDGVLAPGGRSFSFPIPRSFISTLGLPSGKVLPPGNYTITLVLRPYVAVQMPGENYDRVQSLKIQILKGVSELSYELMTAAHDGDAAEVRRLIAEGADVNFPDSRKLTALHYAALKNHVDIMAILVDSGARLQARDDRGNIAGYYLYWAHGQNSALAARYGYTEPRDKEREKAAAKKAFREMMAGMADGLRSAMAEAKMHRQPALPKSSNTLTSSQAVVDSQNVVRYEIVLGPAKSSIHEDYRNDRDHWNGYSALGWQEPQADWQTGKVSVSISGHSFWMPGVDAQKLRNWLKGRMEPISSDHRWVSNPALFKWDLLRMTQWTAKRSGGRLTPVKTLYEGKISNAGVVIH